MSKHSIRRYLAGGAVAAALAAGAVVGLAAPASAAAPATTHSSVAKGGGHCWNECDWTPDPCWWRPYGLLGLNIHIGLGISL